MLGKIWGKAVSAVAAVAFGTSMVAAVPMAALAQNPTPSYAQPLPPPAANHEQKITGTVSSFDGKYSLQVRDDRGFIDNVELHQGTIINPTGLTLAPGMQVTIYGIPRGHVFAANEIDTPYHFVPSYVWGPPGPYWGWGLGFGWRHGYFWGGPW